MTASRAETQDDAHEDEGQVPGSDQDRFAALAREERCGLIEEFWDFLKYNKKWWLLPIVATLLLLGLVLVLGGTAAAPFIYPLF